MCEYSFQNLEEECLPIVRNLFFRPNTADRPPENDWMIFMRRCSMQRRYHPNTAINLLFFIKILICIIWCVLRAARGWRRRTRCCERAYEGCKRSPPRGNNTCRAYYNKRCLLRFKAISNVVSQNIETSFQFEPAESMNTNEAMTIIGFKQKLLKSQILIREQQEVIRYAIARCLEIESFGTGFSQYLIFRELKENVVRSRGDSHSHSRESTPKRLTGSAIVRSQSVNYSFTINSVCLWECPCSTSWNNVDLQICTLQVHGSYRWRK